jgi:hypothetical protein
MLAVRKEACGMDDKGRCAGHTLRRRHVVPARAGKLAVERGAPLAGIGGDCTEELAPRATRLWSRSLIRAPA